MCGCKQLLAASVKTDQRSKWRNLSRGPQR